MTPYVSHNNEIGVRLSFLLSTTDKRNPNSIRNSDSIDLFTYCAYEKRVIRDKALKLRAGGGHGNEVLLRWKCLTDAHTLLIQKFGNPELAHNPMEEFFQLDGKASIFFETHKQADGSYLMPEKQSQLTLDASVLNALSALLAKRTAARKLRKSKNRGNWESCVIDCNAFNEVLKLKYNGVQHNLPKNARRLAEALRYYTKESYSYLLDGRSKNQNAAKVKTEVHMAMLEALLRKHNNFDNEQITMIYNTAAQQLSWKAIVSATVANYRKELGLCTISGSRGLNALRNKKSMQVKRTAPSVSMAYWTLDGWDAELLFQRTEDDKNGHNKTTYHNRLTVVVVMDPVGGIKYPIGYAIGTHENPALIKEAMRNAANHTRELFGDRYKPLQVQSDRYALKNLTPLYEAMTKHFTPARVGNAKSKTIEPYFLRLNKMCQTFYPNWSGFGVTADKENQPNQEYLNKIRHSFPDEQGCREQITRLIEMERSSKVEQYMERWEALPENDRLSLLREEYLYLFGQTHEYTNRLQGPGFTPTIMGQQLVFDSFDTRFRELAHLDWAVKYDPADLTSVLVLNAKADAATKRVKEVVGTYRFELTAKYEQPMALYDRKPGDAAELYKIRQYNKDLETEIVARSERNAQILEQTFIENPQLNDTLAKMILIDSNGQHKNNRNSQRALPKSKAKPIELPMSILPDNYEYINEDPRNQY